MNSKVIKTLPARAEGTLRECAHYGARLVCARYRRLPTGEMIKTVEIRVPMRDDDADHPDDMRWLRDGKEVGHAGRRYIDQVEDEKKP